MDQKGSRRRTVGIAIGAMLLVCLLLGPTLLFGESISAFGLLVLAAILLSFGLLMRLRADAALRPVGTVLLFVGIAVLAVASLVLAIGVLGRY